jgi:cellulose synthase/poly-beta-1,6-N-acetylglucosamine synthase-like glycosyltransferase
MLVSIIIPRKHEKNNIDGLLEDIFRQETNFQTEVISIINTKPSGKARNIGAQRAKGQIFVFIDCDIRLESELFLAKLVKPLTENKNVGVVCASVRIPRDSSKFQIRYAQEILHSQTPVVDTLTNVSVATSACCAISREVFFHVGKFNEFIMRGEDPELSSRISQFGYRVVLAAQTFCYHPVPENIIGLIRNQFRDGAIVASVDIFYPSLNVDVHTKGVLHFAKKIGIFERIIRFFSITLKAIFKLNILLLLAKIFYASGYIFGFIKNFTLKYIMGQPAQSSNKK